MENYTKIISDLGIPVATALATGAGLGWMVKYLIHNINQKLDEVVKENLKKISDDLEKITKNLDKHIAVFEVQNKYLIEMLQRHDRILYGDNGNSAGLNVRVDRIETSAKVLSKISWSGFISGLSTLATFLVGIFQWRE